MWRNRLFEIPTVARVFLLVVALQFCFLILIRLQQFFNNLDHAAEKHEADSSGENVVLEQLWILLFFLINALSQVYFAVNSVWKENIIELWGFFFATILMTIRAAFEIYRRDLYCEESKGLALCTVLVVFSVIFQLAYFVLFVLVYRVFGWRFYRLVGGDLQLRALYKNFELYLSFVKFDVLFHALFIFTTAMFIFQNRPLQWAFAFVLLPISFVHAVLGWLSVKNEDHLKMKIWFATSIIFPAIVIAVLIFSRLGNSEGVGDGIGCDLFNPKTQAFDRCAVSRWIFALLAFLSLFSRCLVILWGVKNFRAFGQGLREKVHFASGAQEAQIYSGGGTSNINGHLHSVTPRVLAAPTKQSSSWKSYKSRIQTKVNVEPTTISMSTVGLTQSPDSALVQRPADFDENTCISIA